MRSWLVIPALGASCAGAAAGLSALNGGVDSIAPEMVIASGAMGAGLSACVRALAGDSPASIVGAVLAPLLFLATLFDSAASVHEWRAVIAVAAAAWTAVELSRPSTSPLVALLPACIACVLDASFVALLPIAAVRVMTAPWERPRWAIAVPVISGLVALAAVIAYVAHGGLFARLGGAWWGARGHGVTASELIAMCGRELGPMTAVAAMCGVAVFARPRHAELGLALSMVGAFAFGMRAGDVPVALVGVAALATGLAVARLAGLIRLASGQAVMGAAVAAILVVVPAWSAIENGRGVTLVSVARDQR